MRIFPRRVAAWLTVVVGLASSVNAQKTWNDVSAIERGRMALTGSSFIGPEWGLDAYTSALSKAGIEAPDPEMDPQGYQDAFNTRYGLHPAPYPNDGLPMGLRRATSPEGRIGVNLDCMTCHGGSILGQSYLGLGNTRIDVEALISDMTVADGRPAPKFVLFRLNTGRGNNNAGQLAVFLLSLRNSADLTKRSFPLITGTQLPELDTPAWWLLKKKKTKYYDGRTPAESVRSDMQFMLGDTTLEGFQKTEPVFEDVEAYLRSLEPPKYPFAVDSESASRGQALYRENCARCHGTYGENWTYPNKVVPLDVIGTDPARASGLTNRYIQHYNATWFGEKHPVSEEMVGYQAPPLDGIWATAPYLHNGSVPTLDALLDSSTRPNLFLRPSSTDLEDYDTRNVGWKVEVLDRLPTDLDAESSKRLFDTSRWGFDNKGHLFGDVLTDQERKDVIEYLKTL